MISRVLGILASQNGFQSMYDKIFNIDIDIWSSDPFLAASLDNFNNNLNF
jgi:hypothetical protein